VDFQDYIEKDYDLRITFVGEQMFPVRIDSQDKVDWRRPENTVSYGLVDVPSDVVSKCKSMMSFFDLRFGCFDFVVKDNEHIFLEVNANGQWAWLENELAINISGAIIEELA